MKKNERWYVFFVAENHRKQQNANLSQDDTKYSAWFWPRSVTMPHYAPVSPCWSVNWEFFPSSIWNCLVSAWHHRHRHVPRWQVFWNENTDNELENQVSVLVCCIQIFFETEHAIWGLCWCNPMSFWIQLLNFWTYSYAASVFAPVLPQSHRRQEHLPHCGEDTVRWLKTTRNCYNTCHPAEVPCSPEACACACARANARPRSGTLTTWVGFWFSTKACIFFVIVKFFDFLLFFVSPGLHFVSEIVKTIHHTYHVPSPPVYQHVHVPGPTVVKPVRDAWCLGWRWQVTLTGICKWCWWEVDYFSPTFWSSPDLHHFGKLSVLNTIHELAACFRFMSETSKIWNSSRLLPTWGSWLFLKKTLGRGAWRCARSSATATKGAMFWVSSKGRYRDGEDSASWGVFLLLLLWKLGYSSQLLYIEYQCISRRCICCICVWFSPSSNQDFIPEYILKMFGIGQPVFSWIFFLYIWL